MTVPTWPQITAAATSLRTVGGAYEHVADALEHDHQILREESTMSETKDSALAARRTKRNPMRCNPDTEFKLGFDAGEAQHEAKPDVDLLDMTEEERMALPATYHRPLFDGLGEPHSWICEVCWGDGWQTSWPCDPATSGGLELAQGSGMRYVW